MNKIDESLVGVHTHTGSLLENKKEIKSGVILLSKRYLKFYSLY